MKERAIPKPGEFYRHFKNQYYQIITVAVHSETKEQMVIYQALYGAFGTYARPLSMFLSEVDHDKYPEVQQTYRFERVECPYATVEPAGHSEESSKEDMDQKQKSKQHKVVQHKIVQEKKVSEEKCIMDKEVERFLDARTYKEKLDILLSMRNDITEKQLYDMAITLDVTIEEGDIDEKFLNLVNCLRTLARFEVKR